MSLPIAMVNDFYLEVARGNVTGYTAKELVGVCSDIDSSTKDIWNYGALAGTNLTLATTAAVLKLSSGSAADITQFVQITGLDANYDEISEVVGMLAGQTKVATSQSFLRVNNVELVSQKVAIPSTTDALLYASSSNNADAQVITITGLDSNGVEVIEQMTLTGNAKVTGTKLFVSVTDVAISAQPAGKVYVYFTSAITLGVPDTVAQIQSVITGSVGLAAAGIVYVYYECAAVAGVPQDATKVQGMIAIGDLHPHTAVYTVPRDKNWYLTSLRYRTAGTVGTHSIVISATRTVYGGSAETVKTVKYSGSATTTNFTDGQVQFTDQPVLFPAKSIIKFRGTAGGTNLNATVEANFVQEDITAVPNTVTVLSVAEYIAHLAAGGPIHNHTQDFWLIGLDEAPATVPATANLDNVLVTITGHSSVADVGVYTVATDTDVAFDKAYFTSGALVETTKKAVFTIMRCVASDASVDYVAAPVNTIINLKNVKKVSYLAA